MALTMATTITLELIQCSACGITFGMDSQYYSDRQADKKEWYCPNGHCQVFLGKSRAQEIKELKEKVADRDRQLNWYSGHTTHLNDQLKATRRQAATLKGQLTKARKRMGAGVCPVPECHRHFPNLAAHMESKHKDYVVADA